MKTLLILLYSVCCLFAYRISTKSAFAARSTKTFHGSGWMQMKSPKESYVCGSCTAAVNVPIYSYPGAVGAIQILVINLTMLSLFTNNKRSRYASVK